MKRGLTILVIALLAGCASMEGHSPDEWASIEAGTYQPPKKEVTTPRLTRDEWIKATNRTYDGITKEQLIRAAEQVLSLAGGEYMKVAHTEDGFDARRDWHYYVVLQSETGSDHWAFRASSTPSGAKGTIQLTARRQLYAYGVLPATEKNKTVEGTAIYDLFWSRMDYMLGINPTWTTCDMSTGKIEQGSIWGETSALCGVLFMDNKTPAAPMISTNK